MNCEGKAKYYDVCSNASASGSDYTGCHSNLNFIALRHFKFVEL